MITIRLLPSPLMLAKFATFICVLLLLLQGGARAADPLEVEEWITGDNKQGDLDVMLKEHVIRALVVFNKMTYFLDKGRQRGTSYEMLTKFEAYVNEKVKSKPLKVKVLFIPVTREQLIPALLAGRGDIAVANLTITPERQKQVAFSKPVYSGVDEILITGPKAPDIKSLDDLSGKTIHSRKSSSYYEHLQRLNRRFKAEGKKPVEIIPAPELLEDSDLLEMVNAGLIPMVIVDSHKAKFWASVFDKITLHPQVSINKGGQIAWAFRKQSPKLEAMINQFIAGHKKGTLFGNIIYNRYLKNNRWARNALSKHELEKFQRVISLFKKYSERYDYDFLLVAALAYQESQLDQRKRSHRGAVGIMQVLPSTAADKNVGIKNIENLENNIHAGTKYLNFLRLRYFSDPSMEPFDQELFSFAAYNAGPAKIARLRKEAAASGLDPNRWFNNVEVIAAKRIGRETVQYVSNIFKYYIAYKMYWQRLKSTEKLTT